MYPLLTVEIGQLVKCLICKHEDPSSIPHILPATGRGRQGTPGTYWLASLACLVSFRPMKLFQKTRWMATKAWYLRFFRETKPLSQLKPKWSADYIVYHEIGIWVLLSSFTICERYILTSRTTGQKLYRIKVI